jgi:hypothetical protein
MDARMAQGVDEHLLPMSIGLHRQVSCTDYPLKMQSCSFRLPCHNGRMTLHEVLVPNI